MSFALLYASSIWTNPKIERQLRFCQLKAQTYFRTAFIVLCFLALPNLSSARLMFFASFLCCSSLNSASICSLFCSKKESLKAEICLTSIMIMTHSLAFTLCWNFSLKCWWNSCLYIYIKSNFARVHYLDLHDAPFVEEEDLSLHFVHLIHFLLLEYLDSPRGILKRSFINTFQCFGQLAL